MIVHLDQLDPNRLPRGIIGRRQTHASEPALGVAGSECQPLLRSAVPRIAEAEPAGRVGNRRLKYVRFVREVSGG